MNYAFGSSLIAISDELNISLYVFTDLPIWNFRIYNSTNRRNSSKMVRVMFTKPVLVDLWEPTLNVWDITKLDLIKLDKFIEENWDALIYTYNDNLPDSTMETIPTNLVKPDYTKLVMPDINLSYYTN